MGRTRDEPDRCREYSPLGGSTLLQQRLATSLSSWQIGWDMLDIAAVLRNSKQTWPNRTDEGTSYGIPICLCYDHCQGRRFLDGALCRMIFVVLAFLGANCCRLPLAYIPRT